jgi:ubiquinone/menaquinone biosynthesis C-methylase UbiE
VTAISDAYGIAGTVWERGPGRVYNRMAEVVLEHAPVPLTGRRILDLGAGAGAASRAISTAGGAVVAVDAAFGMLAADRTARPPAAQADARALPFASSSLEGVVAAFVLNHVPEPVEALRETVRVCEPGSPILVSSYAEDDAHPVKQAATRALEARGFEMEPWMTDLYRDIVPLMATAERCEAIARDAGLVPVVHHRTVGFPELTARDLVEWRFGMAQHAEFVAGLPPDERELAAAAAIAMLDGAPPLTRSMLVIVAVTR